MKTTPQKTRGQALALFAAPITLRAHMAEKRTTVTLILRPDGFTPGELKLSASVVTFHIASKQGTDESGKGHETECATPGGLSAVVGRALGNCAVCEAERAPVFPSLLRWRERRQGTYAGGADIEVKREFVDAVDGAKPVKRTANRVDTDTGGECDSVSSPRRCRLWAGVPVSQEEGL